MKKIKKNLEEWLETFLLKLVAKQFTRSLAIEICLYINEWKYYKDIALKWVDVIYPEGLLQIDIDNISLDISLKNPDDYEPNFDMYYNNIYHVHLEDLLYSILNYEDELQCIKDNIDRYMERLRHED